MFLVVVVVVVLLPEDCLSSVNQQTDRRPNVQCSNERERIVGHMVFLQEKILCPSILLLLLKTTKINQPRMKMLMMMARWPNVVDDDCNNNKKRSGEFLSV